MPEIFPLPTRAQSPLTAQIGKPILQQTMQAALRAIRKLDQLADRSINIIAEQISLTSLWSATI